MKCPNCETEFTGTQCPQCGFELAGETEQKSVSPEKGPPEGEAPPEAFSSEETARTAGENGGSAHDPEPEDTTEAPAEPARHGKGLFGAGAARPESPVKKTPPKKRLLISLIAFSIASQRARQKKVIKGTSGNTAA